MKRLLYPIFIILILSACKKDSSEFLIGRWDFTRLEMPGMETFIEEIKQDGDNDAIAQKKFLLGNKLILRKDSTFDLVMLKQYIHGSWEYDPANKYLTLRDSSSAKLSMTIRIDSVNTTNLIFDIDEFALNKLVDLHATEYNGYYLLQNKPYCQFYLDIDKDKYSDLKDDPYSIENNRWRVKPFHSETDQQIKERVLNHLDFWQQLFTDADEMERAYVAYNWFESPLVVAVNGVRLDFYDEHKQEWDQNFYDSTEAGKGYQMMRKCFSKKLTYLKTENKYKRHEDVVRQLKANYIDALK